MWKLHSFNKKDFVALDPSSLRVRVSVPDGSPLDPVDTTFEVKVKAGEKAFDRTFKLAEVARSTFEETHGIFTRRTTTWHRYVLMMTDKSMADFKRLQAFIKGPGKKDALFLVWPPLKGKPAKTTKAVFSIDLQLSKKDGYFTLFDHASYDFEPAGPEYHKKKAVQKPGA
jgi:hypothetical protein